LRIFVMILLVDDEAEQPAVIGIAHRAQERRANARECLTRSHVQQSVVAQEVLQCRRASGDDLAQQVGLALKVVIDQPRRADAGGLGDVLDGGLLEALNREHRQSAVDDLLAPAPEIFVAA
jgi:hypothetical protein